MVRATQACERRSLIRTTSGKLGLAPGGIKPGDVIAMLFGRSSSLVLRAVIGDGQSYQVVGQYYLDSNMNSEAFLGPLPEHVNHVQWLRDSSDVYWWSFHNVKTEETSVEDPRHSLLLGEKWNKSQKLRDAWQACEGNETRYIAEIKLKCIRKRRVELEEFRII
jgi:hypothetical protein